MAVVFTGKWQWFSPALKAQRRFKEIKDHYGVKHIAIFHL